MPKGKSLKDRRRELEGKRSAPTPSTLGTNKMFRKGKMVTKPSMSQGFQSVQKKSQDAVDPDRAMKERAIRSRKSGTKKANR